MRPAQLVAQPAPIPQLWPFIELRQSFRSRVADISPFVDQLMRFIRPFLSKSQVERGSEFDIDIAVREALTNAVVHGNDEDPYKRVNVTCRCSMDGEVLLTVRDEGWGFDVDALPDPTDPKNLMLTHGRGILLIKALMDEVNFDERGTVVCMRKKA